MSSPSADPVDRVVKEDKMMASVHNEEKEGDATMADNQGISDDSSEEPKEDDEEARRIREGFIVDEDEDEEEDDDETRARRGKRRKRRHRRIAQTASASGSPTLTSPDISVNRSFEAQKTQLNHLETTPYVFPGSRSISPALSTPPSSSCDSLSPSTVTCQFTFPDTQDRAEFHLAKQGQC
ncbi:hypothetical protein M405DRAFT_862886 [Rhizopogon salebrosus TDB-379]|nr:hypothetical protein M405DRAFT_862886 [Rhizopogon salebrosus TDB-379]